MVLVVAAIRLIMFLLAGSQAARLAEHDSKDADLEAQQFWGQAHQDTPRAFTVAKSVYRDSNEVKRFLRRGGRWAKAALSDPRLWHVTETPAWELMNVDRMEGPAMLKVMERAWGGCVPGGCGFCKGP